MNMKSTTDLRNDLISHNWKSLLYKSGIQKGSVNLATDYSAVSL